jgi:hypothetical protein
MRMGDRPGSGTTSIYFDMRIGVVIRDYTTRKIAIGSTATHSALNMWCAAGIYP